MSYIEVKSRTKEILKISLPMMVEHLAISLMGMVSTMLISSVGEHATSALGMVDSVSNLIISLFAALTVGGTIVVAQYKGRDDIIAVKRAGGQAIILSAVFSVAILLILLFFGESILNMLFLNAAADVMQASMVFLAIVSLSFPILAITQTIFGILRGVGDTLTPMIVSVIMNILNLILGIILIRGLNLWVISIPAFGVAGAAYALLISRVIGFIISAWFIIKKARGIRLNKPKFFVPNFKIQKTILRLGVPTSFESGLFMAGKLMQQVFMVSMGTAAIAANTIATSIVGFINVPGMAFATGLMILVGQRVGRGQLNDVKRTSLFAVALSSILFVIICFILFFFQDAIFSLYNPSEESREMLWWVLTSCLIATPFFWAASFITPAALRATGDVVFPMVVSVATMIVLRLVLSYIFGIVLGFGILGVWVAMYIDWIGRSLFFIPRLLNGKWKNKSIV